MAICSTVNTTSTDAARTDEDSQSEISGLGLWGSEEKRCKVLGIRRYVSVHQNILPRGFLTREAPSTPEAQAKDNRDEPRSPAYYPNPEKAMCCLGETPFKDQGNSLMQENRSVATLSRLTDWLPKP